MHVRAVNGVMTMGYHGWGKGVVVIRGWGVRG